MSQFQQNYDLLIKTLLVGNSGVGKSSFVLRYSDKVFDDNFLSTVGVDFKMSLFNLQGKSIKMQIWDTAGQERFRTITSSYYRGAHGIIIVYDLTDRQSFLDVEKWIEEIEKLSSSDITRLLIGNKSDLEEHREVTFQEGQELADRLGIKFIEGSAKTNSNIDKTFMTMAQDIKDRVIRDEKKPILSGKQLEQKKNLQDHHKQQSETPKIKPQSKSCC